jgi:hypothetical protein
MEESSGDGMVRTEDDVLTRKTDNNISRETVRWAAPMVRFGQNKRSWPFELLEIAKIKGKREKTR